MTETEINLAAYRFKTQPWFAICGWLALHGVLPQEVPDKGVVTISEGVASIPVVVKNDAGKVQVDGLDGVSLTTVTAKVVFDPPAAGEAL